MKTGKVWGITEPLVESPLFSMHRLTILPNARCSKHSHKYKWNGFYVESGTLIIEVEKADYPLTDKTVLGPREFCQVRPGEVHWFRTEDGPVEAVEMYYLEPLSEDIVRKDCGSVKPQMETIRVENPDDPTQFVYIERAKPLFDPVMIDRSSEK